jgi:hypothetical protein
VEGLTPEDVLQALERFLTEEEERNGGPLPPVNPPHRQPFLWPPPSLSAQYRIKPQAFSRSVRFEIYGEAFTVRVAETPAGVFGKCEALWAEAKGPTLEQMLVNLAREVEPLFQRQFAISRILGFSRRYEGTLSDLRPDQLILLLYCPDRDVAHSAMFEIDVHARSGLYTPALIRILRDESHPYRRSAQWCALDIFEDLINICQTEEQCREALSAIKDLMMRAEDDYARTIYKAGDVLGDHVATDEAGEVLLEVLRRGPHPVGRRSAIHGLIHFCEWQASWKSRVISELETVTRSDPEPLLREYAKATIQDIIEGGPHGPEPVFAADVRN